jgi:hypothetical protein
MNLDAWVLFARRHGLGAWAALWLEWLEPLSLLGAQASYLIEPLLGRSTGRALRRLLEDDERRAQLQQRLRDDSGADGAAPEG